MKVKDDDLNVSASVIRSVDTWISEGKESPDIKSAVEKYNLYILKKIIFIAVCLIATIAIIGIALTIGAYDIGFAETYSIILDHIMGNIQDPIKDHVIIQMRLPRLGILP